jgi:hypothetical protein
MSEQLALRFPTGTRDRVRALAGDGESMTAVLLRGIAALEGRGAIDSTEPEQPHNGRLAVIEQRLDAIEASLAPAVEGSAQDYPEIVRAGAVKLHEVGRTTTQVRRAIEQACGRAPSMKHMTKTLRRWASLVGGQSGAE